MPVQSCQSGGRPGYKYGPEGKCYTYDPDSVQSKAKARAAAERQGRAIEASKHSESNK